jgi:hypothetical protein
MEAPKITPVRWMSVEDAAAILGIPTISLRRTIERNAKKTGDGSVEARVDGIVAKKCGGRLWRVFLDARWTKPAATGS